MNYQLISQPCRNFQISGIEKFTDPRDGREKVALANFAAGATGSLIIIDPLTGEGESIELPGDNGAWAVLNYRDEKLLIGTCAQYGYLHCLNLKNRQWAEPLRDPAETYIWNLCLGSDGMIYGGTYPGCVLLRYDPDRHVLENMGRVSDNQDNLYSRMVYGDIPGHILISCSSAEPHLALWSMESRTARRFGRTGAVLRQVGEDFLCTQNGGELDFYDLHTFERIDADMSARLSPTDRVHRYSGTSFSIRLADGGGLGVRGQEYYLDRGEAERPLLQQIPAPRPATHILTLIADDQGCLWGAAGFGQTIFRYNPETGQSWNSPVICDQSGEAYGMTWAGGRLFLTCYAGGDHVVYDPAQPWNQIENVNPRTLEPVAPRLIRPAAKSVVGPDGNVWTGWMAQYGVYGGGLSRVATRTLDMTSWYDPIPGQTLVGLTADEKYLYFTTGGAANGLPSKQEPFFFVVWSAAGEIVWKRQFAKGSSPRQLVVAAGRVLAAVDSQIDIFDPERLRFERVVELATPCHYLAALPSGQVAAFCGRQLWLIEPLKGDPQLLGELPGQVGTAAVTPQGQVYFAVGTELYRLEL